MHALTEDVICNLERINQRRLLVDNLHQAFIGNDDQRVDLVSQTTDALIGDLLTTGAFEDERLGHDTDGEGSGLARDLRDHRRCTGAGATSHPCRQEHHVAFLEQVAQLLT